ncbi:hypothetical protein [Klebsiella pneumoniae]|uniref:hypothetical protein n=1 Tax=Klebsiella pneumoniae TaxID=573 RepID=UPI000E2C9108|nr:hypothetical protein [Klebsiella pneumoniae]SYL51113.1 Uncharacterised protein [Klebsiella pneumoniae]
MNNSITRERLAKIAAGRVDARRCNDDEIAMAITLLAALDSEPVAYTDEAELCFVNDMACMWTKGMGINEVPLYRHAQPAPVVPDDVLDALQKVARIRLDLNDFDGDRRGIADCLGDAEEALIEVVNRRAAMLQELQKSAGAEVICRSNENVQALNTIKATPALGSLPKTDEVQNTNSPVIPDGYVMVPVEPNGDMLAAAQDAYGETDGDIASTLRAAMLAAAPQSPGSEPAKDDRDHQLCRRCNDGIRGGCSSCAYNVR